MVMNRGWVMYLSERSSDNLIGFHIEDKLTEQDVERYRTITEGAIHQFGSVRLLFSFDNLRKVTPEAIWEDLKFTTRYKDDIERVALVGNGALEAWISTAFDPVLRLEVKHFDKEEADQAWEWLRVEH